MTTDQLDQLARMLLAAMVREDFDSAAKISRSVGTDPGDLARLTVAMAGVAADAIGRHQLPNDQRTTGGYL